MATQSNPRSLLDQAKQLSGNTHKAQDELKKSMGGYSAEERLMQETTSPYSGYSHAPQGGVTTGGKGIQAFSGKPDVKGRMEQETVGPQGSYASPASSQLPPGAPSTPTSQKKGTISVAPQFTPQPPQGPTKHIGQDAGGLGHPAGEQIRSYAGAVKEEPSPPLGFPVVPEGGEGKAASQGPPSSYAEAAKEGLPPAEDNTQVVITAGGGTATALGEKGATAGGGIKEEASQVGQAGGSRGQEMARATQETVQMGKQRVIASYETGMQKAAEAGEAGRQKIEEGKQKAGDAAQRAQRAAEDNLEAGKQKVGEAVEASKQGVSGMVETAKETAAYYATSAQETANELLQAAKEMVGIDRTEPLKQGVRRRAGEALEASKQMSSQAAQTAKDSVVEAAVVSKQTATDTAYSAAAKAKETALSAKEGLKQSPATMRDAIARGKELAAEKDAKAQEAAKNEGKATP